MSEIPASITQQLFERSEGRCECIKPEGRCSRPAISRHHIVARSRGGKHVLKNLLHVCKEDDWIIHRERKRPGNEWALQYFKRRMEDL
jgi:hypothetical protein